MIERQSCRMYTIEGSVFRTNAYLALYRVPVTKERATKLALLAELLKSGVQLFPDHPVTEIQKAAEALYNALWEIQIVQKGNEAWLSFSLDVLQCVSQKDALRFLSGMMQATVFSEEMLQRRKEILQHRLEAQIDDKRSFAYKRCRELTAKEIVLADGDVEELPKLTANEMTAFYQEIRSHAPLYLFYCGDEQGKQGLQNWKKQLDLQSGKPWICRTILPVPKKVIQVCERTKSIQPRLVLGFVTEILPDSLDMLALEVLCEILGGNYGLLFQEIREKQGLCYDISMHCDSRTGLAFIQMGAEQEQIAHAVVEICQMLQHIQKHKITQTMFAHAVSNISQSYQNIHENQWQRINFVVEQTVFETDCDLDILLRRLSILEVDDICRVAKKLYLQTIYTQR